MKICVEIIITGFGIKTAFLCRQNLIKRKPSQKIKKVSEKSRNKEQNNIKLCTQWIKSLTILYNKNDMLTYMLLI